MLPNLKKGDLVTIISISDFFAHTTRSTIYATGEYVDRDGEQKPIFKDTSRSRKRYTLRPFGKDKLVFVNLPPTVLTLDSEVTKDGMRSFSGNACLNFMQTPLEIQAIIESGNLNLDFTDYGSILSHATNPPQPAYPDRVIPGNHAVVDRIINEAKTTTV